MTKLLHDWVAPRPELLPTTLLSLTLSPSLPPRQPAPRHPPGASARPRTPPGAVIGRFLRCERASVALESAVGISILVAVFASLMGIVHKTYVEDRMERGARAGARAVSLAAAAPASEKALKDLVCKAVEREFGEDVGRACACWNIEVEAFETPQALSGGHARGNGAPLGGENADMVLVRISRPWGSFSVATPDPDNPDPEAMVCADASKAAAEIVVAAVARNEREVRVSR